MLDEKFLVEKPENWCATKHKTKFMRIFIPKVRLVKNLSPLRLIHHIFMRAWNRLVVCQQSPSTNENHIPRSLVRAELGAAIEKAADAD